MGGSYTAECLRIAETIFGPKREEIKSERRNEVTRCFTKYSAANIIRVNNRRRKMSETCRTHAEDK
jgi:hypothetical protein